VTEDGSLWVFPISIDLAKATGKPVEVGGKLQVNRPCRVSWSPDSRWIAFPSQTDRSMEILAGSVKGGKVRQLVELPGDRKDLSGGISWSPDGDHISYEDKDGIWLVPSSGGELRHLVESDEIHDHAWSPDGKRIAFIEKAYISFAEVQSGQVKHIVNLNAHNLDGESTWSLKWSLDGSRLAFISLRKPRYRAFVVSVSGGDPRELAEDDPGEKYYLAWSPDGKKVSYNSDSYFRVRTGILWAMDVEELVNKTE
jgi:Tol biopolymer transport system component